MVISTHSLMELSLVKVVLKLPTVSSVQLIKIQASVVQLVHLTLINSSPSHSHDKALPPVRKLDLALTSRDALCLSTRILEKVSAV